MSKEQAQVKEVYNILWVLSKTLHFSNNRNVQE